MNIIISTNGNLDTVPCDIIWFWN